MRGVLLTPEVKAQISPKTRQQSALASIFCRKKEIKIIKHYQICATTRSPIYFLAVSHVTTIAAQYLFIYYRLKIIVSCNQSVGVHHITIQYIFYVCKSVYIIYLSRKYAKGKITKLPTIYR